MATRVYLANIARVSVGVVAIVWALLGLADALAAGLGRGFDPSEIVAVAVNALLIAAAVLAFARARFWHAAIIVSTLGVTVDRIVGVLGTGDWWVMLSSAAMLCAIVGISAVARNP
jgi:hypothetical protein